MHWRMVRTIIVLPGTVLFLIPAIILVVTANSRFAPKLITPSQIWFWLALLAAGIGSVLCMWTAMLFTKYGEGTPAPWDPPRKLVIIGPYRYVRNPMITGVLLVLLAEEKGLEKRFGDEYLKYKARVPRWIPRLTPWEKAESGR